MPMNLNILTFNVRCFNDPTKVNQLRTCLNYLEPKLDICLLYEFKLKNENLANLNRQLGKILVFIICRS